MALSVRFLAGAASGAAILGGCAFAQQASPAPLSASRAAYAERPVVVETFLSQACVQSPTASSVASELSRRSGIVALTWHVDYWDALPAPGVGAWKDPFAEPSFGQRQMAYNRRLRGGALKMTPQTVIDGVISVAGSQREAVEKRIVEARFLDEMARPSPPTLKIVDDGDGMLRTRIKNVGTPYDAYVVSFRRQAVTKISAGDNAGLTFRETNVVRAIEPIAIDHSGSGNFTFAAPANGLGCAVLVQERELGRIVAARYCDNRDGE